VKAGDYVRHYESGRKALVLAVVIGNFSPGWVRVIADGIVERWHHSSCELISSGAA